MIHDDLTSRKDLTAKQKHWLRRKAHIQELGRQDFKRLRSDLPRYLLKSAKARAKVKGLEFNLETSDITVPDICPILLIPLFVGYGKRASSNSPSIDRIDSSKGYIKGNIRVISHRANSNKGNMTIEEVTRMLNYMKGNL